MWDSQHVEIDSSEKRWWQRDDWMIKIINISHCNCWNKSSYFLMIFEALKSFKSTLQLLLQKVSSLSASSWNSKQMMNHHVKMIIIKDHWACHLLKWWSRIKDRCNQWVANFLITCNYDSHIEINFFTKYLFIFYWHWHVINLLCKSIVTVRRNAVA